MPVLPCILKLRAFLRAAGELLADQDLWKDCRNSIRTVGLWSVPKGKQGTAVKMSTAHRHIALQGTTRQMKKIVRMDKKRLSMTLLRGLAGH